MVYNAAVYKQLTLTSKNFFKNTLAPLFTFANYR